MAIADGRRAVALVTRAVASRVLMAVAALAATWAYVVRVRTAMVDFNVYYRAGARVWAAQPLYQVSDGHYMFKYLPASALLVSPVAALPPEAAKAVWFALSVAAMLASFALVRRIVGIKERRWWWAIPALVLAKYFLRELRLGQINLIVMAVLLVGVRALTRGRDPRNGAIAGIAAGIAAALKPYAALMIAYLAATRRWVSAAAAVVTLGVAVAAPAIVYGIRGNVQLLRDWAATLAQSTPGELTNNDNVSVLALSMKWTTHPWQATALTTIVLTALAAVMLSVIARGRGRPDAAALESAMALTLIPLVSPMGWDYNFILALPAVAILVEDFGTFRPAMRAALALDLAMIALVVYDLVGRRAYTSFMQWSITTVNFVVIVAALAILRRRNLR